MLVFKYFFCIFNGVFFGWIFRPWFPSGNIKFDQVLKVARLMEEDGKSNSKTF